MIASRQAMRIGLDFGAPVEGPGAWGCRLLLDSVTVAGRGYKRVESVLASKQLTVSCADTQKS